MKVLVNLDDYKQILNNMRFHSFGKFIFKVLKNKYNDAWFLNNAGCNLLVAERSRVIKRKLVDLEDILKFLEKVTMKGNIHYALIKVQPFITHLWNDVDLLVLTKDIPIMVDVARNYFGNIVITSKFLKGVTLHINKLSLKLDLYTTVGWRGLSAIRADSDVLFNNFMSNSITCHETSYEVRTLIPELDLYIQLIHIYESELMITLMDFIKMLLLTSLKILPIEEIFIIPPAMLLQLSLRVAMERLEKLLVTGRINVPLPEKSVSSLYILLKNLRLRNTNFRGYYYEIEHLILYAVSLLRRMLS